MSVTSQQNVRVVVDGVEWTPVSHEGNTTNYSLTTGGRIYIFAGDNLAFSFFNEYQADFVFGRNELLFSTPNGNVVYRNDGAYVQHAYPENFTTIFNAVYPLDMEVAESLEASVNQEGVTVSKTKVDNYLRITLTGVDASKPLEIYLGNVLLAYAYPE